MILRCPRCGGSSLEFDVGIAELRRCLGCGAAFAVDDDDWQVGDKTEAELVDRAVGAPSGGVAV